MKSYKIYFSFFVLLFLPFVGISQSPWTQEKGSFYTQFNFSTIHSYDEVFGDPDYFTHREINDNTFQFYGEYGLSNSTTLLISIPFKSISSGTISSNSIYEPTSTTSETKNAFGNIELGIKHNFISKKWLVSGQLNLELNTSSYYENSGIRTGYDAYSITPLISVGKGYNKSFIQAFTGFTFRTNDYSSNFKIGGEGGYKFWDRLWLIAFLDFVISMENGSIQLPIENELTALYVNDQEYTAYGLKAIVEINDKLGVLSGIGGSFSGNNVAKKAAINVGLYYKFNQ